MRHPVAISMALTSLVFWSLLAVMVLKVDPGTVKDVGVAGSYLPFFLLLFLAVTHTAFTFRRQWPKAALWGAGLTLYAILRINGMGHVVNLLLITGLLISLEYYWHLEPSTKKCHSTPNTSIK